MVRGQWGWGSLRFESWPPPQFKPQLEQEEAPDNLGPISKDLTKGEVCVVLAPFVCL